MLWARTPIAPWLVQCGGENAAPLGFLTFSAWMVTWQLEVVTTMSEGSNWLTSATTW